MHDDTENNAATDTPRPQPRSAAAPSSEAATESRDARARRQYAERIQAERDAKYANYDVTAAEARLNDYDYWTGEVVRSRQAGNGFSGDYDVAADRNALEAEMKEAKAAQERNRKREYASIPNKDDFALYSSLGDGKVYISELEHPEYLRYATNDELSTYAYLINKESRQSADEYMKYLEPILTARKGAEMGEALAENGALMYVPYRGIAGLESYGRSIEQLFTDEAVPLTATAYANQYLSENTSGVGKVLGDVSYGVGNVAPSLAASALHPALGKISFGASSYGSTYNNALLSGADKSTARTYATLKTAGEVALQHTLGGISSLGGSKSLSSLTKSLANKIDNAGLRLAAQLGGNMFAEGAEEGLQTYIDAGLRNVILDENNNIRDVSEDALYNGMLGAIEAFIIETPNAVMDTYMASQSGQAGNVGDSSIDNDVDSGDDYDQPDEESFNRQTKNTGSFSELQEYISKKHIRSIAKKYDIGLKGITINIDKNVELLNTPFAGRADYENVGQITFFPNAFRNKEELIRTLFHEKCHVQQFKEFGIEFVLNNYSRFEEEAYSKEDAFMKKLKEKEGL